MILATKSGSTSRYSLIYDITLFKERTVKEVVESYFKPLAKLVENPQIYTCVIHIFQVAYVNYHKTI